MTTSLCANCKKYGVIEPHVREEIEATGMPRKLAALCRQCLFSEILGVSLLKLAKSLGIARFVLAYATVHSEDSTTTKMLGDRVEGVPESATRSAEYLQETAELLRAVLAKPLRGELPSTIMTKTGDESADAPPLPPVKLPTPDDPRGVLDLDDCFAAVGVLKFALHDEAFVRELQRSLTALGAFMVAGKGGARGFYEAACRGLKQLAALVTVGKPDRMTIPEGYILPWLKDEDRASH